MQLKFDANQEHQLQAIAAVVDLFDGQPRMEAGLAALATSLIPAVPNRLDLDEAALLANVQQVQAANKIAADSGLEFIEETVPSATGPVQVRFPNFSVEMETGTGKTYVYLRTLLELYERYGFRKTIVVVPSVAIREGVLKTLQMSALGKPVV
jgi:type III restriction enzyme